jgi:hypothetical protein
VFKTEKEAVEKGYEKCEDELFLVKEIREIDETANFVNDVFSF